MEFVLVIQPAAAAAAAAAADASIAKQGHNSCLYVENSKVSPGTTVQYV